MSVALDISTLVDKIKTPEAFVDHHLAIIEDTDYTETEDSFLLYVQQLLWNEVEVLDTNYINETLLAAIGLYHLERLDITDIRVLLDLYYSDNALDSVQFVSFVFLIVIKEEDPGEDLIRFFRFHMKDYGVDNFDFEAVMSVSRELGDVDAEYLDILSKYKSLRSRPEYSNDILDNTSLAHLEELQYWVTPEIREDIVQRLLNAKLENIEESSYQDQIFSFQKDEYLEQFPVSHKVMGDEIAKFEPRSIDMEELNDVPQEFSREWLPGFVYSKPELEENIRIYFPGGPHIGHSAIVVKSNFGSFMMDFGMSVVNTSKSRWIPLMEKLDFILISHAHMDHSGSLPILYGPEKKLPWFGSRETKIMTEMLWADTRKIIGKTVDPAVIETNPYLNRLVSRGSIINTLDNFNPLELDRSYHLSPSIDIKAHNASHLFGSVGFEIDLHGKRILYTGDFNADKGASFPTDCDISIFDSTYFERYTDYPKPEVGLQAALDEANRILIPSFSMGRSQEMLFKLRELEAEKDWTIYLTGMGGRLAAKLHLNVGSTRGRNKGGVQIVPTVDPEDFGDKSIVIGGQGMLQAGTSRRLFDYTSDDPDTSVILCGYQAPNTLGYHLLNDHDYLLGKYKQRIRRVKISGHTTGETLDKFMDDLSGQKMMVHSPRGAYEGRERKDVTQPEKFKPLKL